ncbi:MAG: D-aminoacylase [Rhodothermales bacterium]|nr:D-aminoacylase [Rhodothermales bacterium]
MLQRTFACAVILVCVLLPGCERPAEYDLILRGGILYDGSGSTPIVGDVAIQGDVVAALGDLGNASGRRELDVSGLAVAPGFINMLSWATETLLIDGKSQSDIRQGVTLEVFGEGVSMGPLNEAMRIEAMRDLESLFTSRQEMVERFELEVDSSGQPVLPWTTLGEYLDFLVARGIAPNVASFVGATTVRVHEVGYENRAPTTEEMERMLALVDEAMQEGALGVGSSLIYAPAFFATTYELTELAKVAAKRGGMYISHLRSEGNRLVESVDELLAIARDAGIRAEIYHLKAAGQANWTKIEDVIARIEAARAQGMAITADMYTYTAGATGLDAGMPPWVQEGGFEAWRTRLQDPVMRARVAEEMRTPTDAWENLMLAAGPEGTLLVGFRNEKLRFMTGMTLAQIAQERGVSPEEAAIDLVIEDSSRVGTVYFLMSEENVRRQLALPWVAFDSDAGSMAPEGVFLDSNPHPRAYGNFARLLGKYVRDEKVLTLPEAIRRLTSFPAENLRIERRGRIAPGYFADIAVFDPVTIQDHATFEQPHQFATGMQHVFVNGVQVLSYGGHTGLLPGRVLRGPGYQP